MIKKLEGHKINKTCVEKDGITHDVELSIICQLADQVNGEGKHVEWSIHFDDNYSVIEIVDALYDKNHTEDEAIEAWDSLTCYEDMAHVARCILEGKFQAEQVIWCVGEECDPLHIYSEVNMEYVSEPNEVKIKL